MDHATAGSPSTPAEQKFARLVRRDGQPTELVLDWVLIDPTRRLDHRPEGPR